MLPNLEQIPDSEKSKPSGEQPRQTQEAALPSNFEEMINGRAQRGNVRRSAAKE
jgi:hypothetical protein